jgi:RAD51-like protein 2
VVVIDTEGSFVPERVAEIAGATVSHFREIAKGLDPVEDAEAIEAAQSLSVDEVLDRTQIFRCTSLAQLLAVVKRLKSVVAENKVALVIVDSIAMHFRHDIDDMALRTRMLNGVVQELIQVAVNRDRTVVSWWNLRFLSNTPAKSFG